VLLGCGTIPNAVTTPNTNKGKVDSATNKRSLDFLSWVSKMFWFNIYASWLPHASTIKLSAVY